MCEDSESVCSEDFGDVLQEISLNVPHRHPLKQSLQCYYKQEENSDGQFMAEMKRIKLKTERIID